MQQTLVILLHQETLKKQLRLVLQLKIFRLVLKLKIFRVRCIYTFLCSNQKILLEIFKLKR